MNLNKKYQEFKRFPLLVKLSFIPVIAIGAALIAGIIWLSISNPFWLLTQLLSALFALAFLKLAFFYMIDYPKLKKKMEEERLEKLKIIE